MHSLRIGLFVYFILFVGITTPSCVFAQEEIGRKYWVSYPKLTKAFNQLFKKVPKGLESFILHQHHIWKKKSCKKRCNKKELEKRIAFYNKQPIDHGEFESVIFKDRIVIPYPKKAIDDEINIRKGGMPPWGFSGYLDRQWEMIFRDDDDNRFQLRRGLNEFILDLRDEYYQPRYYSNINLNLSIATSLDQLVTVEISTYAYGHGAAHGVPKTTFRHYHIKKTREASFAEIFNKNHYVEFKKFIIKLANAKFPQKFPHMNPLKNFNLKIGETMQQLERWSFDEKGANLFFQVYEVASYAEGPQELNIGWKEMLRYLTPFGKSIFKEFKK